MISTPISLSSLLSLWFLCQSFSRSLFSPSWPRRTTHSTSRPLKLTSPSPILFPISLRLSRPPPFLTSIMLVIITSPCHSFLIHPSRRWKCNTRSSPHNYACVYQTSMKFSLNSPRSLEVSAAPTLTVTPANSSVSFSGTYTLAMLDAETVGSTLPDGVNRHWLVNSVEVSGTSINILLAIINFGT